jgi:hypothetical protein
MVDPVEPGLSDPLPVHLDRERDVILPRLRHVLVEAGLELRERVGDDRPRARRDRDLEVLDQLPEPRQVHPLDGTEHDPVTLQHRGTTR